MPKGMTIEGKTIDPARRYPGRIVRQLPRGSWVIEVWLEAPWGEAIFIDSDASSTITETDEYIIITLAPEPPPKPLAAGDVISYESERSKLYELPLDSLIVDDTDDLGRMEGDGTFKMLDDGLGGHIVLPVTVLRVGS